MSNNCNPPTCNQNYDPSCESLDCVFNVDAVNVDKLFKRTEDLREAYEGHDQRLFDVENIVASHTESINEISANLAQFNSVIVTNQNQFLAALNLSRPIIIRGTVTLTAQFNINIPTRIIGEPGSKLVCQSSSWTFNMAAPLEISNLLICGTSNNVGYFLNIGGTQRAGANANLRLISCWFQDFGNIITMTGGPTSPLGPRTIIYDCDFKNIGGVGFNGLGQEGAIYMDWNLGQTIIDSCRFHDGSIWGNPVWLGHSAFPTVAPLGEALYVTRNHMVNFHRNGIETFIAGKAFVMSNYIEGGDSAFTNTPPGSGMGISLAGGNSVAANNYIKNVWAYGIEAFRSNNTIEGNTIDGLLSTDTNPNRAPKAISIDQATTSTIKNNTLRNITHSVADKYGIVCTASTDITIKSNTIDNVTYGIWVNFNCERITIRDNDLRLEVDPNILLGSKIAGGVRIFAGTKHKILNNVATVGPILDGVILPLNKANLFSFEPNSGGYVDFTPTLIGPVVSQTSFQNTSSNIVV